MNWINVLILYSRLKVAKYGSFKNGLGIPEQRYIISVLQKEKHPQNSIAERIGKHCSVVSRELQRNRDLRSNEYKPDLAQRKYEQGISTKPKRVNFTESIRLYVESKLRLEYSPEQILGVSQLANIDCVSVERIYQHIWADKKNGAIYILI